MIRTVECRIDAYRDGAKLCELTPVSASIRMEASGKIKTSLSCSLLTDERVEWLTDELHPMLNIDGEDHACGVFLPTTVRKNSESGAGTVSVEAYDRCWLVQNTITDAPKKVTRLTRYTSAIETLLTECGITLTNITACTDTVQELRVWETGTSYLDIINELLTEINYKALWFDAMGYAMIEPQETPEPSAVTHSYSERDITCLMADEVTEKLDIFSQPNKYIVVCSNPDKSAVMRAVAVNDNPLSPLSTVRRGRTVSTLVKVNNIASQSALQAYANNLVKAAMFATEQITIKTALQPGHGVRDVISIAHSLCSGVGVETGWRMDFKTGGYMTHTFEKVVYDV